MRRAIWGAIFCAMGLWGIALLCALLGLRFNTTASYPLGLYRTTEKTPGKGDLVIFCPPPQQIFAIAKKRDYIGPGFCNGGYGPMIKRILAAKGDRVSIGPGGVQVNGQMIANSLPMRSDASGRILPILTYTDLELSDTDVLLMSDFSSKSFDARYFGAVNASQIISVIQPLFTW